VALVRIKRLLDEENGPNSAPQCMLNYKNKQGESVKLVERVPLKLEQLFYTQFIVLFTGYALASFNSYKSATYIADNIITLPNTIITILRARAA